MKARRARMQQVDVYMKPASERGKATQYFYLATYLPTYLLTYMRIHSHTIQA